LEFLFSGDRNNEEFLRAVPCNEVMIRGIRLFILFLPEADPGPPGQVRHPCLYSYYRQGTVKIKGYGEDFS